MRRSAAFIWLMAFLLPACSGVNSEVKKQWTNSENTIQITNVTSQDSILEDAGARLNNALEESLIKTSFILVGKKAKYRLKYKVLDFDEGSRLARIATLGISESSQGKLKVKAALFNGEGLVGAWVVDSWIKGGLTGGSDNQLFTDAADEIISHLKGDL